MLLRIGAGSPEAMQQAEKSHDIVQSRMNLRWNREYLNIFFWAKLSCTKINSYTMWHGEIFYMQWKNATYVLNGTHFFSFQTA